MFGTVIALPVNELVRTQTAKITDLEENDSLLGSPCPHTIVALSKDSSNVQEPRHWIFMCWRRVLVATFVVLIALLGGNFAYQVVRERDGCNFLVRAQAEYVEQEPLKIGIVILCGGEMAQNEMGIHSVLNKKVYAERHGYTLIDASEIIDRSRPPAWSKLLALKANLANFDYLMWIDTDTVIMNMGVKLEWIIDYATRDALASASKQPWDVLLSSDLHGPNVGTFMVRNSEWTSWFLDEWWAQVQLADGKYVFEYEQRGIHYLMDTHIWRSQYILRNAPKYPGDSKAIVQHIKSIPQCAINSYVIPAWSKTFFTYSWAGTKADAEYVPGDFIVHLAGFKGAKKHRLFDRFYRQ